MISKVSQRAFKPSLMLYLSLLHRRHPKFTTLSTYYREKGILLTYPSIGPVDIPIQQQIRVLCTSINLAKIHNDYAKVEPIVGAIATALGRFSAQQQFSQFQTVVAHIKFQSLKFQSCEKYGEMVDKICWKVIESVPSLSAYYETIEMPDDPTLAQTITYLLNLNFILKLKDPSTRDQLQAKIYQSIRTWVCQLNESILTCFMADSITAQYNLPFELIEDLYEKMNLDLIYAVYRYYFIKFSDYQMQREQVYPFHTFLPLYSNLVKFNPNIPTEEVPALIDNIVSQFKLCQQTVLKIMPNYFFKKIIGIEKFLNDRKISGIQLIKIYNELSSVCPLGLRFVREISYNRQFKLEKEELPIVKEYLVKQLRNLESQYIYSIDEKLSNEVNLNLITLVRTLVGRYLLVDNLFLLEIAPLFNFYHQFNSKFVRQINKTLIAVLENFNVSLPKNRTNIYKLVNFLYVSRKSIVIPAKTCREIIEQFLTLTYLRTEDVKAWKCLFQVLSLYESVVQTHGRSLVHEVYQKLCRPYLIETEAKPMLIRKASLNEEYILRIANLFEKKHFAANPQQAKILSEFVHRKFIYSVKSVMKEGVVQILSLLGNLPPVSPQIHSYLYSNLSTFILCIQSRNKFFLQRGKNFQNDLLFINVLRNATDNYQILAKISQKNRLNILAILAVKYWANLTKNQIAKILIIMGDVNIIGEKMKSKLKNTKFLEEDVHDIDMQLLSIFKRHNKSLLRLCQEDESEFQQENISFKELNSKSPERIKRFFQLHECYEQAIEEREFVREDLIPEPMTSDPKVKMIYVCLKIIGKIRNARDFSIRVDTPGDKEIDLKDEIRYINENSLIKQNNLNEFKLENLEAGGENKLIEGWSVYEMLENLMEIEYGYSEENPFKRVLIALYGNIQLIKQLVKKETFNSEVLFAALQLNLDALPKGSMIEISSLKKGDNQIYVLCSNPINYKLHMIYAFILQRVGYQVRQIDEKNSTEEITAFLGNKFKVQPNSKRTGKGKVIEEDDQEEDLVRREE